MEIVLMVIHFLIAVLLVGIVLLQRSEQGALAHLGGSGGMGGLMSARGAANLLTKATGILACCFFVSSLILALMFKNAAHKDVSFIDQGATAVQSLQESAENTSETPEAAAAEATVDVAPEAESKQ